MGNAEERSPKGERRILTLLFCDVVDFTPLSHRIDPEQLRDLLAQSRRICTQAIQRYGGHVANYVGDGLLACFGYPHSSEHNAPAAVNAALEMVQEHQRTRWDLGNGDRLALNVRVGIHTGLVVVGDIAGAGDCIERDALVGAAPNMVNRIQQAAPTNGVVLSAAVEELVHDQFELRPLGHRMLKGAGETMDLFQVVDRKPFAHQVERVGRSRLLPLIGREDDLTALLQHWDAAQTGTQRWVLVRGEAGIGKSRLIREVLTRIRSGNAAAIFEFQCTPYHASAGFFPVARCLAEQFGIGDVLKDRGEALELLRTKLAALDIRDPADVNLVGVVLGLVEADTNTLQGMAPEVRKARTLTVLTRCFAGCRRNRPALFLFSDLHWVDASTEEWISSLARTEAGAALFILSSREAVPWVPQATEVLSLSGFTAEETRQLARAVADKVLPTDALNHIVGSTGGVPLFVEELTAALLRSGLLIEAETHFDAAPHAAVAQWAAVPGTLEGLLLQRIDETGPAKAMLQLCAVIGQDFPADLAVKLWDGDNAADLLQKLVEQNFLLERRSGGTRLLAFRHALIRNAAYESQLKTERAHWHRRAAEALRGRATLALESDPTLVAQHFSLAGMKAEAVVFWTRAAANALARSAYAEAIAEARRGLELLRETPDAPDSVRDLGVALHATLGMALVSTEGFSSSAAAQAFERATVLSRTIEGPSPGRSSALSGLWIVNLMQGRLRDAERFAAEMRSIGTDTADSGLLIEGLWAAGVVQFYLGRLDDARQSLEQAVALYRPEHHRNAALYGQDPGVAARVYLASVLCFLGRIREAERVIDEALVLARRLGHAHSLAWALGGKTMIHLVLGHLDQTLTLGTQAIQYSMEQAHHWWLCATRMMVGWAEARTGKVGSGCQSMQEGFNAYQRLGSELVQPVFCALVADGAIIDGQLAEAAKWVERGRQVAEKNDELISKPALLLLEAQLHLLSDPPRVAEAEAGFRQALVMARAQQSRLRELQAATALAHLLMARGARDEAREALASATGWFDNQPEIPSLTLAQQMLQQLNKNNGGKHTGSETNPAAPSPLAAAPWLIQPRPDYAFFPGPYHLKNAILCGVLFKEGAPGALQRLVDDSLNRAIGSKRFAVRLGGWAIAGFFDFAKAHSDAPDWGSLAYKESTIVIPVFDEIAGKLCIFNPVMMLDSFFALVAGREIHGFPKVQGRFQSDGFDATRATSSGIGGIANFGVVVHVEAYHTRHPSETAGWHPALAGRMQNFGAMKENVTPDDPKTFVDTMMLPEEFASQPDAATLFRKFLGYSLEGLFLKQFPSCSAITHACYQRVIAAPFTPKSLTRLRFAKSATITAWELASYPLASALGFGKTPGKPIHGLVGFAAEMDWRLDAGREL